MQWRVLDWRLDSRTRDITGPDGTRRLRPKAYRALRLLLERAPAVVSKEEITDAVWGSHKVSEGSVAQIIRELRTVLGEEPAAPRIIATRHRQGYQCVAPVSALVPESREDDSAPEPVSGAVADPPGNNRWRSWKRMLLVASLLLASAVVLRQTVANRAVDAPGWPTDPRARPELARGLHAARLLQSAEALRHLEAAAGVEDSPRLRAWRARLLLRLGRREEAEALIHRSSVIPGLAPADRLQTLAVTHEIAGRLEASGRIYSTLTTMFPDDPDYPLAWLETAPETAEEITTRCLDNDEIPTERRLLLAAWSAGRNNDPEAQYARAETTLFAARASAPVIAALARDQMAGALASQGDLKGSRRESSQAIEALLELGEAREAFTAWRHALGQAKTPDRMLEIYAAFEATLGETQDPLQLAELAFSRGRLEVLRRDYRASLPHFELAARRFTALDSPRLLQARRFQAGSLMRLGEMEEAQRLLYHTIRRAESFGAPQILGTLFNTLANVKGYRGESDQAIRHYERALAEYRRAKNISGELLVLSNLSTVMTDQGKFSEALELSAEALAKARDLGDERRVANLLHLRAGCQKSLGKLAASLRLNDEALAVARETGRVSLEAQLLLRRSEIQRQQADLAGAEQALQQAAALSLDIAQVRGALAHGSGWLAREQGRPLDARDQLEQFHRNHPEMAPSAQGFALALLSAQLHLDADRAVRAEQEAREVLDQVRHGGHLLLRRDAQILLGRALATQGKVRAAEEQLELASLLSEEAPELQSQLELALALAQLEGIRPRRATDGELPDQLETSTGPLDRGRRRLLWVVETASAAGFRLLALETRVELARQGGSLDQVPLLARELEERGLIRLRRQLARSPHLPDPDSVGARSGGG